MYPLVEAAAVLPPADAMALSGRPIAMAHHISSLSSSSSMPTEKAGKKAALQAAGRWTPSLSLSRVVPPPDSSCGEKDSCKGDLAATEEAQHA